MNVHIRRVWLRRIVVLVKIEKVDHAKVFQGISDIIDLTSLGKKANSIIIHIKIAHHLLLWKIYIVKTSIVFIIDLHITDTDI